MDISKDSNFWGVATLTAYVGAIAFMVYLYYRDSKKTWGAFQDQVALIRDGVHDITTPNGKGDEYASKRVVEDYRNDSAQSDATGI